VRFEPFERVLQVAASGRIVDGGNLPLQRGERQRPTQNRSRGSA